MSKPSSRKKPPSPALATSAPTPPPPRAPWRAPRWLPWALTAGEVLTLSGLFIFMLAKSWLRWSDPLIDFPKNLYLAWRLSEGDLLYQQVTNWYGPLSHLVEAAGFRAFGVGIDTIVGINIALSVGAVLLVRGIFGTLGNRLTGWLSALVFIPLFVFGHFNEVGNYNFITPYASQATYSFVGLLLVLWGLLRQLKTGRPLWLGVAGLGMAIAYLDKLEVLFAATGALGIYLAAQLIRVARQPGPAGGWRSGAHWAGPTAIWLAGGFLIGWLPVFGYFWSRGGLAYAWRAANFVPLTLLNGSIMQAAENSPLMQGFFGSDHEWKNIFIQTGAGGILLLICGAMVFASWRATRTRRWGGAWWLWVTALLAAAIGGDQIARYFNDWLSLGRALAFPVILAMVGAAAGSLWAAWRGSARFAQVLGLAVVGTAAGLMLARILLNAKFPHYGFFMMPLAVMFWIQLVVVEAARISSSGLRKNWLLPAVFSLLTFSALQDCILTEVHLYGAETMLVGSGRDRLYTFPLRILPTGAIFDTMIKAFKLETPHAQTLVAFPEGIALNYHLRVPSTLAELEFHPVAMSFVGPDHILAELKARPPAAVFVFLRDYAEFTDKYFGQSTASGRDIMHWVLQEYELKARAGQSLTYTHDMVDLFALKPSSDSSPPQIVHPKGANQ